MRKLVICSVLLGYILHFGYCRNLSTVQQIEQTLITSLLTGYNKNIRPEQQVSVDITASLQQIVSIDEKQQIMTSSSFITQTWFDSRLEWEPSSANNGTEVVMLPVKSLWIPDTIVLNSADANGYLTVSDYSLASVLYTGQVCMILPALTIKTRCNLYVQKFPFDEQMCSINLTSWGQGYNRLFYTENNSVVIDISGYSEHPVWKLKSTDLIVFDATDRVPFETTFNAVISIQLYLRRKPLFFMMNGIFAFLVLNCVILLSYTLPFATQIGMTSFMTYSVYSLSFSNLFPQQSDYLMMITLYFLLAIGWTLISMAWFIMRNHYVSQGDMPPLLYNFSEMLQKLFFCCFPTTKDNSKADKKIVAHVENGEIKISQDTDITISTGIPNSKDVPHPTIFASHSQNRIVVENSSGEQQIPMQNIEPMPVAASTHMPMNEASDTEKSKCNFCNRCKSCQADFDKEKTKSKSKKDIEAKCGALNYLVFLVILLGMFISNMALWLSMSN